MDSLTNLLIAIKLAAFRPSGDQKIKPTRFRVGLWAAVGQTAEETKPEISHPDQESIVIQSFSVGIGFSMAFRYFELLKA